MKQSISNLFQNMKTGEIIQYFALVLTACAIPFSWNWAVWGLSLLILTALIRFLLAPHKPTHLTRISLITHVLLMLFFILYLISLLYSTNIDAGLENIGHKLPFLLLPLFFLFSDVNQLRTKHIRLLLYLFTLACCILFLVYSTPSFKQILNGQASYTALFGDHGIVKHHTYYAMYFLLCLAFIYMEFNTHGRTLPLAIKIALIIAAIILAAFVIFIQSRSGILCLAAMFLWAMIHLIFVRKKYLSGILTFAIITGTTVFLMANIGDGYKRLTHTIVETATEGKKDIRFEIAENATQVISQHWLFGVGSGDRIDELDKNHDERFGIDTEHPWPHYNPHNQYLDCWVAVGLPGLLILLSIILVPGINALQKRSRNELLLALLFIVACSSLFESTMERQMGIIFFNLFLGLLLLPASTSIHCSVDEPNPHTNSSDSQE